MLHVWNLLVWLAETLDPINSLIGLLTSIFAGFTAIFVWRESRKKKKWWQEIRRRPGARPGMLVLDLLPGQDISAQVENFRLQQESLKNIPDDRVVWLRRNEKLLPEHMPELHLELQEKVRQLMQTGADRIHLFLAAPQPLAAAAGATLANMSVLLYHYDRDKGTYVNYGPLRPNM